MTNINNNASSSSCIITHRSKILIASILCNIFVWFCFGLMMPFLSVFSQKFFPQNEYTQVFNSLMFAAGLVSRPLGAYIFGPIADKFGHKKSIAASMMLMAFATCLIAFIPTFEDVGYLSVCLLLVCRWAQGMALGGNYSTVMVSFVENAPKNKKGLMGSLTDSSTQIGIFLTTFMFAYYTQNPILSFNCYTIDMWRVIFCSGILLTIFIYLLPDKHADLDKSDNKIEPENSCCVIGAGAHGKCVNENVNACNDVSNLHISNENLVNTNEEDSVDDVVNLENVQKSAHDQSILDIIKAYWKTMLDVFFITSVSAFSFYSFFAFFPTYLACTSSLPATQIAKLSEGATMFIPICTILSGYLSDKFSHRLFLNIGTIGMVLSQICLYSLQLDFAGYLIVYTVFGISIGTYYGPRSAFFTLTFPKHVRCTALSLAFTISLAFFGGSVSVFSNIFIKFFDLQYLLIPFGILITFGLIAMNRKK